MELPDDVLRVIREYSRPIGRPWKKGSYLHQNYKDPHSTLVADLMYHVHVRCKKEHFKESYAWFIENHALWKHTRYAWCYGMDSKCCIS